MIFLEKTDLNSDVALMPVETEDADLLSTVDTFLDDEKVEEAKPWSDESEKTKFLTVLDVPQEPKK